MVDDIRLDEEHLKLLVHAAEVAGARLDPDYMGTFRPADSPRCVALFCTSPGQLMHFAALVAIAFGLPDPLLLQMTVRVQEDGPYRPGGERAYYWPGICGPELPPVYGPEPRPDFDRIMEEL